LARTFALESTVGAITAIASPPMSKLDFEMFACGGASFGLSSSALSRFFCWISVSRRRRVNSIFAACTRSLTSASCVIRNSRAQKSAPDTMMARANAIG